MIDSITKVVGAGIGISLIILLAVIFPFLFIWALNTLFGLTIVYNLETWSAVVLLQMFFHTSLSIKRNTK
jgi:hypothetical protein